MALSRSEDFVDWRVMTAKDFDRYHEMRKTSRIFRDGFRRRAETVIAYLRQGFAAQPPRKFGACLLDVGTADGTMLHVFRDAFRGISLTGLEASEDLVEVAREQGLNVVCSRVEEMTFEREHFDAVTIVATLKHIPDARAALAACHSVIVPGGHIIVADPTPMGLRLGVWRGHFDPRWLPNRWTLARTRAHLEKAGFEVVTAKRYMPLPVTLPGMGVIERVLRWMGLSRLFMQQATLARKVPSVNASRTS